MKITHIFKCRKFLQIYIILFFVGFGLVLISCYPGDPISSSEADIVTTFRNANANFATKQTFSLPDSVIHIDDNDETTEGDPILDQQILSAIERNMEQSGFDLLADPDQADVLVVPMVTSTTFVGGGCYPWYWDSWYYYPGWCYPDYYSYETGTLLIIMVDPDHADDQLTESALWISGINGLVTSQSDTLARLGRDIDQAFEQSPYLSDGK